MFIFNFERLEGLGLKIRTIRLCVSIDNSQLREIHNVNGLRLDHHQLGALDKTSLLTRPRVMGGGNHSGAAVLLPDRLKPLVPTPQILSLSRHRALSRL